MAKQQKSEPPPDRSIQAPSSLVPIMQAFHVDSDKAAKVLIQEAANTIYGKSEFGARSISKDELDGLWALMKGMNPRDGLETLYAAQIVACHMLGMRKLAEPYMDDQKLGLNLLRFSNEAMQQLEKKRSGGAQNITVNYNYSGQGNALMETIIPDKGGKDADSRS
ncbi:MAG: hypothetical protein WCF19_00360 [Chlamydiales bacterium]